MLPGLSTFFPVLVLLAQMLTASAAVVQPRDSGALVTLETAGSWIVPEAAVFYTAGHEPTNSLSFIARYQPDGRIQYRAGIDEHGPLGDGYFTVKIGSSGESVNVGRADVGENAFYRLTFQCRLDAEPGANLAHMEGQRFSFQAEGADRVGLHPCGMQKGVRVECGGGALGGKFASCY